MNLIKPVGLSGSIPSQQVFFASLFTVKTLRWKNYEYFEKWHFHKGLEKEKIKAMAKVFQRKFIFSKLKKALNK